MAERQPPALGETAELTEATTENETAPTGKAIVLVSHDHRVLDYADRVVWLEDGLLEDREPASMASPVHGA